MPIDLKHILINPISQKHEKAMRISLLEIFPVLFTSFEARGQFLLCSNDILNHIFCIAILYND